MTTWIQETRTAIRALRRRPLFTGAFVLTLAVGIGATTAVFSTADALLFRSLPFQDPDELVFVPLIVPAYEGRPELEVEWSYPKVRLLLESTDAFQASTTYQTGTLTLTGENNPEEIRIESVGPGYFGLLGVEMVEGRTFQPEEDQTGQQPFVAILSHELWVRRYGGSPEILGRTVRLNDNPYTVVGIAQAGFPGLSGSAQLWIPVMTQDAGVLNNPNNHAHELFARLREGVSLAQVRAQLGEFPRVLAEAYPPDNPNLPSLGIRATPLRELRSDPFTRTAVLFLLGAVVTVLFIACLNLGNLLLVRARKRGPEMAIRAALGAGRSRIVGQVMTESALLAAVGCALGVMFAAAWIPFLKTMGLRTQEVFRPVDVGLTSLGFSGVELDVRGLIFSACLGLLVAIPIGLGSAILASRPDIFSGLKGNPWRSRQNRRLPVQGRTLIVASQVALAFALLTCGGLMLGSLSALVRSDVGIQSDDVLTARIALPRARYGAQEARMFWAELLERTSHIPEIRSVGANFCPPLSDRCTGAFVWFPDRPTPADGVRPMPQLHPVGGDYFGTLGIPLLGGRLVGPEDRDGAALTVVVGESAANTFWPGEDPIGKEITIQRAGLGNATVVGIVGDVSYSSVESGPRPAIYLSLSQFPSRTGYVVLRTARATNPLAVLPTFRGLLGELDPLLPLTDIKTMSERLADATSPTRFTAIVLNLFAAAGLALSVMGVFGVLALVVGERTREFGLRRALGAGRMELYGTVLIQSGWVIVLGLILGAVLSWSTSRLLGGLLFGLHPHDPRILLSAAAIVALSALAASLIPAFRAAKVDPLLAIRQD